MKRIGIFGTSGFAREVADVADRLGYTATFIAIDKKAAESWRHAGEVVLEADVDRYADMPFAIGVGDTAARQRLATRFASHLRFPNLVDPAATFGRDQMQRMASGTGVIVAAGVRFMSGIDVGDFSFFDLNATIGHDCRIGSYAHIAPGANVAGHVHVGTRAWVGSGAAVNQGEALAPRLIGADTIIGSGAVVVSDCDPNAVYAGVPARKIR